MLTQFRTLDTFTDRLARPTDDPQKVIKTSVFNLEIGSCRREDSVRVVTRDVWPDTARTTAHRFAPGATSR